LEDDLRKKMKKVDEKLSNFRHLNPYSPFWEPFGKLLTLIDALTDDVIKMLSEGNGKFPNLSDRKFWRDLKTNIQVVQTLLGYR
jgi:hypothetical protein